MPLKMQVITTKPDDLVKVFGEASAQLAKQAGSLAQFKWEQVSPGEFIVEFSYPMDNFLINKMIQSEFSKQTKVIDKNVKIKVLK